VTLSAAFSPDYFTARHRFREVVDRLGWTRETHPIEARGPQGEELTIDVALSSAGDPAQTLLLSSGLHGIEGLFGSAVQLAALERWAATSPPPVRCVLLHGLNPFGFAWHRRFDENNVDPNRNFLLPGEPYAGAPKGYARLDSLLNPRRPPSRWEPFRLMALAMIARQGLPALKQAVAAGQYDFPKGLFFGGTGPSAMHRLLDEHLPRWLAGSGRVVHLDFHTGLGRWATWMLLIDHPLSDRHRAWLTDWFGADRFEDGSSRGIAYDARGGLGRWCVSRQLAADYVYACAEFGTYGPIQVLGGLRTENQAQHWSNPAAASTIRAKQRLQELFCPQAESWRTYAVEQSLDLITRALRGMRQA